MVLEIVIQNMYHEAFSGCVWNDLDHFRSAICFYELPDRIHQFCFFSWLLISPELPTHILVEKDESAFAQCVGAVGF